MKLCLAQYEVARGQAEANLEQIEAYALAAKQAGAELLCLPEMCTTGFDWKQNRQLLDQAGAMLDRVGYIARSHAVAICGSFLEKTESGRPANSFHYFDASGQLCVRYRKLHLFTLFHEERHVEAGDVCKSFETPEGRFGATICYDLRFPELYRRLVADGARVLFVPAAFPHPRLAHWQTLIRARAIENQCYVVATNQCGLEGHGGGVGETRYFGHSTVVDPWGEICLEADESEGLLEVEIELSEVDQIRNKLTAWDDRRTDLFSY